MKVSPFLSRILAVTAFVLMSAAGQATVVERPLSSVSFTDTLSDAHTVAARHGDMQVLRIAGTSMLPFFGEGSVVIVKKIATTQLRAGMVVVYQNRFGETVAHRLIEATTQGWTAQGYNNSQADSTVVNAENMVGVVYATLHSNGRMNGLPDVAGMMAKTPVALAAPAK